MWPVAKREAGLCWCRKGSVDFLVGPIIALGLLRCPGPVFGEIWIENNFNSVVVYPSYGGAPIKTFTFSQPVTGLASHNMWMALGGNGITELWEIGNYLAGAYPVGGTLPSDAYSLAWDLSGNIYYGTIQDTLNVTTAATNVTSQLVSLGYFPWGIAVDHARGRVYVSDANHNQINVYNATTGALLHTIQ